MRTSLPATRKTGETILTRPPEADLIPVITLPDAVFTGPDTIITVVAIRANASTAAAILSMVPSNSPDLPFPVAAAFA